MFLSIDQKDVFYVIVGSAFLVFKILPNLAIKRHVSAPMLFVLFGMLLTYSSLNFPLQSFVEIDLQRKILEHFTELIVIISLAGAGLAIDRQVGIRAWHHTWILIIFVMPITMGVIAYLGYSVLSIPLASAVLLAAVLSPTDPVLARSVQVEGPNTGEENDVNVSLTSEAGLNDGLAFPFVYLAILLAAVSLNELSNDGALLKWFLYDLIYRVLVGVVVGVICGLYFRKILPKLRNSETALKNDAGLILLCTTFLSYGFTELVSGYGFLAVFISAVIGKSAYVEKSETNHIKLPHLFSEQFEKILFAMLLLWLGYHAANFVFPTVTSAEITLALIIILLVRPAISYFCLLFSHGSQLDRFAISFLGIRGIGTLYYLSYAQNNQTFQNIDTLWNVSILAIIFSVFIHGLTAEKIMLKIHQKPKNSAS